MSNLVLGRKFNESIMLKDPKSGNLVKVTVVKILGDQVRLSIDAPRSVQVDRLEIYNMKNV